MLTELYNSAFFSKSDGIEDYIMRRLRDEDALPALCYAHGFFGPSPALLKIESQVAFLEAHAKRTPKRVLEIGCGRGEVTLACAYMGYDVTAIEPAKCVHELIENTGRLFFLNQYPRDNITVINKPLSSELEVDYSCYDTILMIESLEHIPEEHFAPHWKRIAETFSGYFIVTNLLSHHPLKVGQHADKKIHCREVNDKLYDEMGKAGEVLYRRKSHLCMRVSP